MRLTRITLLLIALIIGLGFHRLVTMLVADVPAQTFQATEEVMVDVANVLASLPVSHEVLREGMSAAERRVLDVQIFELQKSHVGIGIYITDATGKVVFDSDGGRRVGEDYSQYNDVVRTLRGEYGARSSRIDPADSRTSILHVAAPILGGVDNEEITGVLTVFKAKLDAYGFVQRRQRSIFWTVGLIGAGVIGLVGTTFWWLFRPVGRLTEYAQNISRGGRPSLPKLGFGKEVNTLGNALADMRESLEGRQYAERYVQNLTHELKSPLAAIRGAAELLDEDMPREDRTRFLANIRAETERSERVIQNLLSLSAIEGKTHLDRIEAVDLAELTAEVIAECAPVAGLRDVMVSAEGKAIVSGDRLMIHAAIENLIENAIEFSLRGGAVHVAISETNGQAILMVTDEGEGFPDYALDRAFERFYSLGRPGSGKKGSGLGLSLVRETAELHGGGAVAENRKKRSGARLTLTLPTRA